MILKHANPVALEIPEIWNDLLKKRARAISVESARENFLTKYCNIIYQGAGTESFIDIKDLQCCRVNKIDWTGREVYVGVDLSMSNDNTAVAICAEENGRILADVVLKDELMRKNAARNEFRKRTLYLQNQHEDCS